MNYVATTGMHGHHEGRASFRLSLLPIPASVYPVSFTDLGGLADI